MILFTSRQTIVSVTLIGYSSWFLVTCIFAIVGWLMWFYGCILDKHSILGACAIAGNSCRVCPRTSVLLEVITTNQKYGWCLLWNQHQLAVLVNFYSFPSVDNMKTCLGMLDIYFYVLYTSWYICNSPIWDWFRVLYKCNSGAVFYA